MRPFAIGIQVEDKYVELLVQEFELENNLHYQCTVGNSIVFWIERDLKGSWRQLDGTINPLTSIIGQKIDQYKQRQDA
jgi:hypothetical protein